jgi:hypothetical protein
MWVFFTLVGLGLTFMWYVLVQLHGEIKGRRPRQRQAENTSPDVAGKGPLLHITSKRVAGNDSGKTGTNGWSHGNGEIRFRSISTTGDVLVRRVRASARARFGVTAEPGGSPKAR